MDKCQLGSLFVCIYQKSHFAVEFERIDHDQVEIVHDKNLYIYNEFYLSKNQLNNNPTENMQ